MKFLGLVGEEIATEMNSLQYELDSIISATNKFSDDNMIGEGGFGAVYKVIINPFFSVKTIVKKFCL